MAKPKELPKHSDLAAAGAESISDRKSLDAALEAGIASGVSSKSILEIVADLKAFRST